MKIPSVKMEHHQHQMAKARIKKMFTNFMAATHQSTPTAVVMKGAEAQSTSFTGSTRVTRRNRRYNRLSR
jgi:hypothetical protein